MPSPDRKRIRIEVVADVTPNKADFDEVLRNGLHPLLKPFSEGGWGLGILISRYVHDYDEWVKGELATDDAAEARGYRRAVVNLVEPAHKAIDLLEPCPPMEADGATLTPAGRLAWYREHLTP